MEPPEFEVLKDQVNEILRPEFELLAITCACRIIAAKRGLTLEQQMAFWVPPSWRGLDDF